MLNRVYGTRSVITRVTICSVRVLSHGLGKLWPADLPDLTAHINLISAKTTTTKATG